MLRVVLDIVVPSSELAVELLIAKKILDSYKICSFQSAAR